MPVAEFIVGMAIVLQASLATSAPCPDRPEIIDASRRSRSIADTFLLLWDSESLSTLPDERGDLHTWYPNWIAQVEVFPRYRSCIGGVPAIPVDIYEGQWGIRNANRERWWGYFLLVKGEFLTERENHIAAESGEKVEVERYASGKFNDTSFGLSARYENWVEFAIGPVFQSVVEPNEQGEIGRESEVRTIGRTLLASVRAMDKRFFLDTIVPVGRAAPENLLAILPGWSPTDILGTVRPTLRSFSPQYEKSFLTAGFLWGGIYDVFGVNLDAQLRPAVLRDVILRASYVLHPGELEWKVKSFTPYAHASYYRDSRFVRYGLSQENHFGFDLGFSVNFYFHEFGFFLARNRPSTLDRLAEVVDTTEYGLRLSMNFGLFP